MKVIVFFDILEPLSYVALELLFTLTLKSSKTSIFSKLMKDLKNFGTRKQGKSEWMVI